MLRETVSNSFSKHLQLSIRSAPVKRPGLQSLEAKSEVQFIILHLFSSLTYPLTELPSECLVGIKKTVIRRSVKAMFTLAANIATPTFFSYCTLEILRLSLGASLQTCANSPEMRTHSLDDLFYSLNSTVVMKCLSARIG